MATAKYTMTGTHLERPAFAGDNRDAMREGGIEIEGATRQSRRTRAPKDCSA
jgi:hypothetical protein